MPKYTVLRKDGDVVLCSRCDSEAPTQAFDLHDERGRVTPGRLCRFCAETELGSILQYPRAHQVDQTFVRGLCHAFNLLEQIVKDTAKPRPSAKKGPR